MTAVTGSTRHRHSRIRDFRHELGIDCIGHRIHHTCRSLLLLGIVRIIESRTAIRTYILRITHMAGAALCIQIIGPAVHDFTNLPNG